MTPPTPPDTGAIRKRLEKITPEVHAVILRGERGTFHFPLAQTREAEAANSDGQDGFSISGAYRDFFAHAPADIAALLDLQERTATALKSAYEDNTLLSEQIVALHAENSRLRSLAKEGDTP